MNERLELLREMLEKETKLNQTLRESLTRSDHVLDWLNAQYKQAKQDAVSYQESTSND